MWAAKALLKHPLPLNKDVTLPEGKSVTITKGVEEEYAVWCHHGVFDVPKGYIGRITRIISEDSVKKEKEVKLTEDQKVERGCDECKYIKLPMSNEPCHTCIIVGGIPFLKHEK